jgi:hypothetical protein
MNRRMKLTVRITVGVLGLSAAGVGVAVHANGGGLPEIMTGDVGVVTSIALLESNMSRHHLLRNLDSPVAMRAGR